MIVVIIAGGAGSRLWPLSTPDYPKHLLKVNGNERSLMQNAYDRAKRVADEVYVVSDASHIHHVKEQLSEIPDDHFITEPARRGTANCVLAALAYIGKHHDTSEPIAAIHADHYIRDSVGFARCLQVAQKASTSQNRIVLVGVEPDNPATGFGYIKKGELLDGGPFVFNVEGFKEKPDLATAQQYLRSGQYLWNCGYFVGSVDTFKQSIGADAPDMLQNYQKLEAVVDDQQAFNEAYLGLETMTIDVGIMEKVRNLLVVPASFDWMDLGSFSDLAKAAESDEAGNHVEGLAELEEVENTFVQNHEDKPLAVIGLDNVVVVNTPQGILIARKDLSQKVGDVGKRFRK